MTALTCTSHSCECAVWWMNCQFVRVPRLPNGGVVASECCPCHLPETRVVISGLVLVDVPDFGLVWCERGSLLIKKGDSVLLLQQVRRFPLVIGTHEFITALAVGA